jgi:hypothetical protein
MKILVACEYSGVVREAFRQRGHDAWSCDILPAEDGSKFHFQEDCLKLLNRTWDLLIGHPPCTYLCNSGVKHLWKDAKRPYPGAVLTFDTANLVRWNLMEDAQQFFLKLWTAPIKKIALENPVPHGHAVLPPYTQTIQPYQFGHMETKRTCLWLTNLPPLQDTNNVKAATMALPYAQRAKIHYASPGKNRSSERSRTYQGIADAMASQWG